MKDRGLAGGECRDAAKPRESMMATAARDVVTWVGIRCDRDRRARCRIAVIESRVRSGRSAGRLVGSGNERLVSTRLELVKGESAMALMIQCSGREAE